MTTPDDNPSFLARLAIVATIGAVLTQIAGVVMVSVDPPLAEQTAFIRRVSRFNFRLWVENNPEAFTVVIIAPAFIYLGTAVIYYLFKGRPTGVDSRIASRLYYIWGISLVAGVYALDRLM